MGLAGYIIRRILLLIPTFFIATAIIFLLIHFAPGDPIQLMFAESGHPVSPLIIEQVRRELGLEQPLHVQYLIWIGKMLSGDLGVSYSAQFGRPVLSLIGERVWVTVAIMLTAEAVSLVFALALGVIAASKQYSAVDNLCTVSALLGYSMPTFWTALVSIMIFAVWLGIFPSFGFMTHGVELAPFERVVDVARHLVLPVTVISFVYTAYLFRLVRSNVLEVLRQDYITTARAKGVKERMVVYKHALRNALLPTVTFVGLSVGFILSGSVVVETVFSIPGLGSLFTEFALKRDYPALMALSLMITVMVLLANLCTDIAYGLLDPRIKY